MKFNQEAAQAGYKLAIPALEALIRTHQIPQQIGYFFDTDHPETARQLQYIKEHGVSEKWTTSFMVKLAAKAAVKNYGNHFAVNNRFFLETLLKEAKTGSLRLMGVIREAMDMEELPAPEQTEDVVPLAPDNEHPQGGIVVRHAQGDEFSPTQSSGVQKGDYSGVTNTSGRAVLLTSSHQSRNLATAQLTAGW